jgi:hypothetical protein
VEEGSGTKNPQTGARATATARARETSVHTKTRARARAISRAISRARETPGQFRRILDSYTCVCLDCCGHSIYVLVQGPPYSICPTRGEHWKCCEGITAFRDKKEEETGAA